MKRPVDKKADALYLRLERLYHRRIRRGLTRRGA